MAIEIGERALRMASHDDADEYKCLGDLAAQRFSRYRRFGNAADELAIGLAARAYAAELVEARATLAIALGQPRNLDQEIALLTGARNSRGRPASGFLRSSMAWATPTSPVTVRGGNQAIFRARWNATPTR